MAIDERAALEARVRKLEHDLKALQDEHNRLALRFGLDRLAWEVQNGSTVVAGGVDANDGKGWVCEEHQPVQHRDKRPPWCNRCGRGPNGTLVGVPGWLRRIAQEQSPAGERAREEVRSHEEPQKPIIVGTEWHQFIGAGDLCEGQLGDRSGRVCGARHEALIHSPEREPKWMRRERGLTTPTRIGCWPPVEP